MNKLRDLRKTRGITQETVANFLGVSRATYTRYENGTYDVSTETLGKLAEFFEVSTDYLLGIEEWIEKAVHKRWVPVLENPTFSLDAGVEGDINGFVELPEDAYSEFELFALTVVDDRMAPFYLPGDQVLFRCADRAESGDDVLVRIRNEENFLRRFKRTENGIALIPLNPACEPLYFSANDVDALPVLVIGIVVEMRRNVDPRPPSRKKYRRKP